MKVTIVFCGTMRAVEHHIAHGAVFYNPYDKGFFGTLPDRAIVVCNQGMIHGWRRNGATVVFDSSWEYGPDHPMSVQARARGGA